MEIQDTLLNYAEVAVALAGFSAIVVVLRGNAKRWRTDDANMFHGMIVHAGMAVVFCLLPIMLNVVVQDVVTTLRLACTILGVQILAHSGYVMFFLSHARTSRWVMLIGLLIGLVQFAVYTDWGVHREFDFYQLGIAWHILQAGVVFVLLVWIPKSAIDDDTA